MDKDEYNRALDTLTDRVNAARYCLNQQGDMNEFAVLLTKVARAAMWLAELASDQPPPAARPPNSDRP